jgi:dTDP-4-amino-4,6-dideoxygalactose transaminase
MSSKRPVAEGGVPVRSDFLHFARPCLGVEEIQEVVETLRSGWLTVGPRTKLFEKRIAEYVGTGTAAALSSCTAGLKLGMLALGVKEGDEVVFPALDFVSGPNSATHLGARPVLADIDPASLNVTAETVERALTDKTKLVVPVHFGGRPCDMAGLLDLLRPRGIAVLGDAAHALGASYADGRKVGSVAEATAFSFYVTKGITTGEGGAFVSHDAGLVERVGILSLHGMSSGAWSRYSDRGAWFYDVLEAGYKCNMTDVQAALGIHQLERADEFRVRRAEIAAIFDDGLASEEDVETPAPCDEGEHAWHLYTIRLRLDALKIDRDRFIRSIMEEGIGASVHFIPIHYHSCYRDRLGYARGSLPATESFFEQAVSLPIYPSMTDADAMDVVEAVKKLLHFYKR